MSKKFKFCFKDGKLVDCNEHKQENAPKVEEVLFENNKCKVLTNTGAIYKDANDFFSSLPADLFSLDLPTEKYEKFMKIITNVAEQTTKLCSNLIGENEKCAENLKTGTEFVLNKLKAVDTPRKLEKEIQSNPFYVPPQDVSIGLKWSKPKVNKETNIPDHKMTQASFPYISIIKTLNVAFSDENFQRYYIKYNTEEKHKCQKGIYRDFCCGSTCQEIEIFDDPLALHLQLGIDDFEICCALKSKAGIHKVCATYLQIRNMPLEYRSKLENIYLVALCTSAYLKPEDKGYNYVAELIVKEIAEIEKNGIKIGDRFVRGSLINVAGDNLGINSVFGFTECFVANYYCRMCECHKTECQSMTKANKKMYRTVASYQKYLKIAENPKKKLDLTVTKGIRRKCKFNDLKFFHTAKNWYVDCMHDCLEGTIIYNLHDFFKILIEKKILTADEIQRRVRDFNYSPSFRKDKPSLINLDKHNLNQNASQLYCLFMNLPFIFSDVKESFGKYYEPVMYLQKCLRIIFSKEITENDLKDLENFIHLHLSSVIEVYGRTLTAKHHFLLHYPDVIRKMGPVIHFWSMRIEAKHKFFTDTMRKKKNFKNPTKTMASHHQYSMCKAPHIVNEIKVSNKSSQFSNTMQFEKYEGLIKSSLGEDVSSIRVHKFAKYNSIEYREGSLIITENKINEIVHILTKNSKIVFICEPQNVLKSDDFLNSFILEKEIDNAFVLDFASIEKKVVYDKIYHDENFHVIVSTLDLCKVL